MNIFEKIIVRQIPAEIVYEDNLDEDGVVEDKKYRLKETDSSDFWSSILNQKTFHEFIQKNYQISNGEMLRSDIDEVFDDVVTMNGVED